MYFTKSSYVCLDPAWPSGLIFDALLEAVDKSGMSSRGVEHEQPIIPCVRTSYDEYAQFSDEERMSKICTSDEAILALICIKVVDADVASTQIRLHARA